jgi:hypothetical protein
MMPSNPHSSLAKTSGPDREYLESLIRVDYEHCHPGEALEDMKHRASFSKEDKGLFRDWIAVAAGRAATKRLVSNQSDR